MSTNSSPDQYRRRYVTSGEQVCSFIIMKLYFSEENSQTRNGSLAGGKSLILLSAPEGYMEMMLNSEYLLESNDASV